MARKATPMTWAQTRQRCFRNICIGVALGVVVLIGLSVPLLKSFYVAGTTKHILQPMFIGPAKLAVAAIGAVWDVPGIPFWWAHASWPNTEHPTDPSNIYWMALFGVAFIGCSFLRSSRHNFQTMRNAKQLAHEERLKEARLGPLKAVPPQHNLTVTAGTITGSAIGVSDGASVELNFTHHNLNIPAVKELANQTLAHIQELSLPAQQRIQLWTQLSTIQRECASPAPNHTVLREASGKVIGILEHVGGAAVAHMLVTHWHEILRFFLRQ